MIKNESQKLEIRSINFTLYRMIICKIELAAAQQSVVIW